MIYAFIKYVYRILTKAFFLGTQFNLGLYQHLTIGLLPIICSRTWEKFGRLFLQKEGCEYSKYYF